MRNLIDFIIKYNYWIVFFVLEGCCLGMLFKYNSYQGSVFFTTANGMVGSIYSTTDAIYSFASLKEANSQLEMQNEMLRKQVHDMQLKLEAKEKTSRKVMFRDSTYISYRFVNAQVINSTLYRSNNMITIDKGESDGVRPQMGVVCSEGVVGVVYLTSSHYSIVVPLLNLSSKVSCKLKDTNYFGTLEWQRGDPTISYMSGVPRHSKVKKGQMVVTNGYSDIFPVGVPIGKVEEMKEALDGMSYVLKVRLTTNFASLHNVSVITNYTQPERHELEAIADSIVEAEEKVMIE